MFPDLNSLANFDEKSPPKVCEKKRSRLIHFFVTWAWISLHYFESGQKANLTH